MRIAIGSDHRGWRLKERLRGMLEEGGHEVIDVGCTDETSTDYPDYAFSAAEMVGGGEVERGIVVCGSGIGMSIAANKVRGVRAALCRTTEDARASRIHNDANVLALSEGTFDNPELAELVRIWLETPFEGGRHLRRINKISAYEDRN